MPKKNLASEDVDDKNDYIATYWESFIGVLSDEHKEQIRRMDLAGIYELGMKIKKAVEDAKLGEGNWT